MKMILKIIPYHKILIVFLCIGLTACAMKVTDPNDPRFDVSEFRFEDYRGQDIQKVMQSIFPVGTEKRNIENIMERELGLKSQRLPYFRKWNGKQNKFNNIKSDKVFMYDYTKPNYGVFGISWQVTFLYDEHNRLKALKALQSSISPM
ncbi:MAG: hypothetical protein ACQEQL_01735 [Pseudomonadota bacterium]